MISCRWQTCRTRCITANVLQTNKADAQCDKLATELSWQYFASNVANLHLTAPAFNLPHLHLAPPLRVTLFEFCRDFRRQKTRVSGLSCGVVRVILRLATLVVAVERWLVTDGRTDRQTDRHTTAIIRALASVARVMIDRLHRKGSTPNQHTSQYFKDIVSFTSIISVRAWILSTQ